MGRIRRELRHLLVCRCTAETLCMIARTRGVTVANVIATHISELKTLVEDGKVRPEKFPATRDKSGVKLNSADYMTLKSLSSEWFRKEAYHLSMTKMLKVLAEIAKAREGLQGESTKSAKTSKGWAAAGPWRTDEPPKDGCFILADFGGTIDIVHYVCNEYDRNEFECLFEKSCGCRYVDDPIRWAELKTEE